MSIELPPPWTSDELTVLQRGLAQGWSFGKIAQTLGNRSRSAVAGQVRMRGLRYPLPTAPSIPQFVTRSNGGSSVCDTDGAAQVSEDDLDALTTDAVEAESDVTVPPDVGVALIDLGPRSCRFPVAEYDKIYFCGEETRMSGDAFCAHHHRISYVPIQRKR
jgi:hypothetical protein